MKNKLKQYIVILFVLVADIASASNPMGVDLSGVWQIALGSLFCADVVRQLRASLLNYMTSEQFTPVSDISAEALRQVLGDKTV